MLFIFGANYFKSSTKNRRVMLISLLSSFPIEYPFNLFNMKDSGSMLKINNTTNNPSPILYLIRFGVKDTFSPLMCMFVVHDYVSVSITVKIKGGNLASFKDSINHSWGTESSAFCHTVTRFRRFCFTSFKTVLFIKSCSRHPQAPRLPPACSVVTILLISQCSCTKV